MVRSKGMKRFASLAVIGLIAAGTAACGGNDDNGGNGSGGDTGSSGTQIGVILPDATTSPRWEANDKPSLSAAFDAAGVTYDIQNAQGDTAKFGQLCDQMIG